MRPGRSYIDETGCEWLPLLPSPAAAVSVLLRVWGRPQERRGWVVVLLWN